MPKDNQELDEPVVAILPWGNVVEDFLDPLNISVDEFATEMNGSWLFGYAGALKRVGVSVVVVCMSNAVDKPRKLRHRASGATVWILPSPRVYQYMLRFVDNPYGASVAEVFGYRNWPWLRILRNVLPYLATSIGAIARVLRKEKCSVVFCQEYESPRFDLSVILGKRMSLPVYGIFQGGQRENRFLDSILRARSLKRSDGVIVASSAQIARIRRCYDLTIDKILRIPNPVDLRIWNASGSFEQTRTSLGISHHKKVVAWHGRIDIKHKGLDILLDAWRELQGRSIGLDIVLLLIGRGVDDASMRIKINEFQSNSIVWVDRFIHDQHEISSYLSCADIYVMSSRKEGFPVAPLEAMACGLPIVSCNVEGMVDILPDREESGGIIVEKLNSKELAEAVERVLSNDTYREKLSINAVETIREKFSMEAVGQQIRTMCIDDHLGD